MIFKQSQLFWAHFAYMYNFHWFFLIIYFLYFFCSFILLRQAKFLSFFFVVQLFFSDKPNLFPLFVFCYGASGKISIRSSLTMLICFVNLLRLPYPSSADQGSSPLRLLRSVQGKTIILPLLMTIRFSFFFVFFCRFER